MKNPGKQFEDDFKKSIPDYCLAERLKDSAQSFNQSKLTKFTWNNPCDFLCFDSIGRILYCLELKSTKSKYITFDDINKPKSQDKMIKKHQIESLQKFSLFDNVVSGFILNFRDEEHDMERTYFLDIKSFDMMRNKIRKFSFNELDLLTNNAVKIVGQKKRVHYNWDIDGFLNVKH